MDSVLIEELTLKPIGTSKELGFKPLRITVNGKPEPLIFDARDIAEIKRGNPRSPSVGREARVVPHRALHLRTESL